MTAPIIVQIKPLIAHFGDNGFRYTEGDPIWINPAHIITIIPHPQKPIVTISMSNGTAYDILQARAEKLVYSLLNPQEVNAS